MKALPMHMHKMVSYALLTLFLELMKTNSSSVQPLQEIIYRGKMTKVTMHYFSLLFQYNGLSGIIDIRSYKIWLSNT